VADKGDGASFADGRGHTGCKRTGDAVVPGNARATPRWGRGYRDPIDPVEAWGDKDRHYVAGAIEAGAYAGR